MKMKILKIGILLFMLFVKLAGNSQTSPLEKPFYFDIINGPYLFVDHIPYDAVMMTGARLGYQFNSRLNANIEYVVGQQQDDQNTLGMTHNVNAQFCINILSEPNRFAPYLFTGGGFMEFKSFTKDVYGIQYNLGIGTTVRILPNLSGIIETRYFNLGLMDLGGQHELAVFWGLRCQF